MAGKVSMNAFFSIAGSPLESIVTAVNPCGLQMASKEQGTNITKAMQYSNNIFLWNIPLNAETQRDSLSFIYFTITEVSHYYGQFVLNYCSVSVIPVPNSFKFSYNHTQLDERS